MAAPGKKISELTTANPIAGDELIVVVQSGETRQSTAEAFATYVNGVVGNVDAAVSVLDGRVSALETDVGTQALEISALVISVANASAVGSTNTAAITSGNAARTSTNNVVSELEVRVSAVSAVAAAFDPATFTSINSAITSVGLVAAGVSVLVSVLTSAVVSINAAHTSTNSAVVSVAAVAEINSTDILELFSNTAGLVGGTAGQVLAKVDVSDYNFAWASVSAAPGGSGLSGTVIVSVSGAQFEHEQSVTVTGMTVSSRPIISLGTMVDADENAADMLDIFSMGATPGTNLLTIYLSFGQRTSGAIPINWSAT